MLHLLKNKKQLVFVDQAIVSGCNFLLNIFLARWMGMTSYGEYALIWMGVLFLSAVQIAYLISPMLTESAKRHGNVLNNYLSAMKKIQFWFVLGAGLFFLLFLLVMGILHRNWDLGITYLCSVSLAVIFFLLQDFYRRSLILMQRYFQLVLFDVVAYLGLLLLVAMSYWVGILKPVVVYQLLFVCFAFSWLTGVIFIREVRPRKGYSFLILKDNWKHSKWLVGSALVQWGGGNYFILALGFLIGSPAVGAFRGMQSITAFLNVIFIYLENTFPTFLALKYKKNGMAGMSDVCIQQMRYGIALFAALMIIVLFLGNQIVLIVLGKQYIAYTPILVLLLFFNLLVYLSMLVRYKLRVIGFTKDIFTSYLLVISISVISAAPLINAFGLYGAAVGMIVSQILMVLFLHLRLKFKHFRDPL